MAMSQGAPIATTANTGLQALGTGGQLAIHAWDQIASYLRRTRGEAHAALFAEPNPDPDRGIIDWYDAQGGEATPIAQLPAPQAAAANAELARLVADIQADAAQLAASKRPGDRFLGELLAQALRVPGPEARRAIGTRPVLVAWGHARADGHAENALLVGDVGRRASAGRMRIVGPPPPRHLFQQQERQRQSRQMLGGALASLLLLLLALLLVLLDPLDWFRAPAPYCVVDTRGTELLAELRREQDRESMLRAEIARLAREAGDRRVACPPPPAPPMPPPRPAEVPPPRPVEPPQQQPAEAVPPQQPPAEPPPQQAQPVPPPAEPPKPPPSADAERARDQGGKSGKVQVILAWDDETDLDLIVACPGGGSISFRSRQGCGGGQLDVDRNAQPPRRRDAVENISWPEQAPAGRYEIIVENNSPQQRNAPPTGFRVTVRVEGQPDRTFTGRAAPGSPVRVGSFEAPPR